MARHLAAVALRAAPRTPAARLSAAAAAAAARAPLSASLEAADAATYRGRGGGLGPQGADCWPDGTPKRFQGREAWKNWINWDSAYTEQTDELNRRRHFFYHVDNRGRLFRRELGELPPKWPHGEIRDSAFLEYFFAHVQPAAEAAEAGGYAAQGYGFVSRRAHEAYWLSCASAPVVFNHFAPPAAGGAEGAAVLRLLCPGGELAAALDTPLRVPELRMCAAGEPLAPAGPRTAPCPWRPAASLTRVHVCWTAGQASCTTPWRR